MGHLPSWDPAVASDIVSAIRAEVPHALINMSTGVLGPDISGPLACMRACKPEVAALNAGSLNYLKIKSDGAWAWPPMLFDNPVDKVKRFADAMRELGVAAECECFDTGILRSVVMYRQNGLLADPVHVSLVMGVASGMPAKAAWLPLLTAEMAPGMHWQTIAIGRAEVWELHQATAALGGHLRTGLEDTFYLPNGEKARSNGDLIEALVGVAKAAGRRPASAEETRALFALHE